MNPLTESRLAIAQEAQGQGQAAFHVGRVRSTDVGIFDATGPIIRPGQGLDAPGVVWLWPLPGLLDSLSDFFEDCCPEFASVAAYFLDRSRILYLATVEDGQGNIVGDLAAVHWNPSLHLCASILPRRVAEW